MNSDVSEFFCNLGGRQAPFVKEPFRNGNAKCFAAHGDALTFSFPGNRFRRFTANRTFPVYPRFLDGGDGVVIVLLR